MLPGCRVCCAPACVWDFICGDFSCDDSFSPCPQSAEQEIFERLVPGCSWAFPSPPLRACLHPLWLPFAIAPAAGDTPSLLPRTAFVKDKDRAQRCQHGVSSLFHVLRCSSRQSIPARRNAPCVMSPWRHCGMCWSLLGGDLLQLLSNSTGLSGGWS